MPFSPSDISGLQFWLRADDLDAALNDGDPVSTWEDRQNNHDFANSSSLRPLFKTNIAGSMPGVLFDGNDDYLSGGDLQSLFPSAATLFIVYQPISDSSWVLARNNSTDTWWDFSGDGYLGTFRTARIGNYPTGVPSSGRHSYALKSSSSTYQAYLDGIGQTAQTASYADGEAYFYIGGSPSDPQGQNRHLNGYIFEVIAYDTALSSGDITSLETYAEALWSFGTTQIVAATLTTTPTLPAGKVNHRLTGVAKSATPSFPTATIAGVIMTGVVLTTTPTLPAGSVRKRLTGVVLTITPSLPAGSISADAVIAGVTLTTVPRLPAGALHYGGSPNADYDFWFVFTGPADFS